MKKLKIILLIIFIVLFCFSCISFYKIYRENTYQKKLKNSLIEEVVKPEDYSKESSYYINFEYLESINSDVVGWIIMEDTKINYPIVQGSDNDYYLKHTFDKKYNTIGSIYMDYRAKEDFSSYNTFIYGHNTYDGSMFADLSKYKDFNFYKDHPIFYIYTSSGNYRVKIFSFYIDDVDNGSYKVEFSDLDDYKNYIEIISSKSIYNTNVNVDYTEDKIVSLYSCSGLRGIARLKRYFMHGILEKIN